MEYLNNLVSVVLRIFTFILLGDSCEHGLCIYQGDWIMDQHFDHHHYLSKMYHYGCSWTIQVLAIGQQVQRGYCLLVKIDEDIVQNNYDESWRGQVDLK